MSFAKRFVRFSGDCPLIRASTLVGWARDWACLPVLPVAWGKKGWYCKAVMEDVQAAEGFDPLLSAKKRTWPKRFKATLLGVRAKKTPHRGLIVVAVAVVSLGLGAWLSALWHACQRQPSIERAANAKIFAASKQSTAPIRPSAAHAVVDTTDAGLPSVPSVPANAPPIHALGPKETLPRALTRVGITTDERKELFRAFKKLWDVSRARPGQSFAFERNAEGKLISFRYILNELEEVSANRNAQGALDAKRHVEPIVRKRVAFTGTLSTTLGDALQAQHLPRSLAGSFYEALDGRIALSTQAQLGDQFRILVDEEHAKGRLLRFGQVHAIEWKHANESKPMRVFWYAPESKWADYYDASGQASQPGWIRAPVHYERISSRFDPKRKHPVLKKIMPHMGVDFAASHGTPMWAAAEGRVSFVGKSGPNGNLVLIQHADGYQTGYAHLSRFAKGLKRGARVEQRQLLGYVGSTGRSTGPHLHFSLKKHGRFVDPLAHMKGPNRTLPSRYKPMFEKHVRTLATQLTKTNHSAAVKPTTMASAHAAAH